MKSILISFFKQCIELLEGPPEPVVKLITFKEYQKEAYKTAIFKIEYCKIYPALALSEEVGELLGKLAKAYRDEDGIISEERMKAIRKEAGDVLWQLSALLTGLGLDLGDIAQENLNKLKDRQDRGVLSGSGDNR